MNKNEGLSNHRTTKIVTQYVGIIGSGLAGIIHGIFAMLRGNVAPDNIVINPIGPKSKYWSEAALHAITIIPNYFISGLCAIIIGIIIIIWVRQFINKKYGARILFLLSIILLFVGGGFGSAFLGIIASLTATQINRPLSWWRNHIPNLAQHMLVKSWPWSLIIYLLFFISSIGVAIFGIPFLWLFSADTTYNILINLGPISDVFLLIAVLAAFSQDIIREEKEQK